MREINSGEEIDMPESWKLNGWGTLAGVVFAVLIVAWSLLALQLFRRGLLHARHHDPSRGRCVSRNTEAADLSRRLCIDVLLHDDNLLTYADSQRAYVLDLRSRSTKGTSLGAGSMPGW